MLRRLGVEAGTGTSRQAQPSLSLSLSLAHFLSFSLSVHQTPSKSAAADSKRDNEDSSYLLSSVSQTETFILLPSSKYKQVVVPLSLSLSSIEQGGLGVGGRRRRSTRYDRRRRRRGNWLGQCLYFSQQKKKRERERCRAKCHSHSGEWLPACPECLAASGCGKSNIAWRQCCFYAFELDRQKRCFYCQR